MKRRDFIAAGLATGTVLAGGPLLAHDEHIVAYDMPEAFAPREVFLRTKLEPFEIHVDPASFALYWTLPGQKAMRYSVGIGRPGLYHDGEFYVGRKAKWPSWRPTDAMIAREPDNYGRFIDGVAGGINNPLGARALYLYQPGRGDTHLRIHGTNSPGTIGRRVSNGCARIINHQIVDLYERVPADTRVVLYPIT